MGQRTMRQGVKVIGRRRSALLVAVVTLALLGTLVGQGASFVGLGALSPVARAAVSTAAVRRGLEWDEDPNAEVAVETQEPGRILQMPEVNYFTNQAIMDCLQEGCSIEVLEELIGKLQRDERRIQEALDELRAAQEEQHSADIAEALGWFRNFLDNSRQLREALQSVEGLKHATTNFAKQFVEQGRRRGGDTSGGSEASPSTGPSVARVLCISARPRRRRIDQSYTGSR
eukprot:CAMPEP_0115661220 /NCGR_PEP_ID=MMETSP0272-20121206/46670_1 /TAXON_ID=71861 /ORGANISM="Scrippsiella trochoidea, Strain CCMP3099" /LENGTH=229 /DNA_ID=CAMNT_0003099445 /DNA_START=1 /DNA_END=687 /DNA_ORIENTATION=+